MSTSRIVFSKTPFSNLIKLNIKLRLCLRLFDIILTASCLIRYEVSVVAIVVAVANILGWDAPVVRLVRAGCQTTQRYIEFADCYAWNKNKIYDKRRHNYRSWQLPLTNRVIFRQKRPTDSDLDASKCLYISLKVVRITECLPASSLASWSFGS